MTETGVVGVIGACHLVLRCLGLARAGFSKVCEIDGITSKPSMLRGLEDVWLGFRGDGYL